MVKNAFYLAFGHLLGPDVFAAKTAHGILVIGSMVSALVFALFPREQVASAEKKCSDAIRILVLVRVQAGQLVAFLGTVVILKGLSVIPGQSFKETMA